MFSVMRHDWKTMLPVEIAEYGSEVSAKRKATQVHQQAGGTVWVEDTQGAVKYYLAPSQRAPVRRNPTRRLEERFRGIDYGGAQNAKLARDRRARELRQAGWTVKTEKWDFSDLARDVMYTLSATKET